ncbi:transposase, IS4 family [Mycolicibacterium gilvum]|uniref:Transposase, IS4 family n=1 Tax=Mycolicibacterium gilvum TaxID=1804 RepID=A0A378SK82_9MYCO|nr:transposase, IS4 family [Mycolicibacterium gilvum]
MSTGRNGPTPTHVEDLADGSWLAHLRAAKDRHGEPMLARVIDYTVDDGRDNPVAYRLLTTLTDPDTAPAVELAAAYAQRWEIESVFDELKTHQRGSKVVLRSKSPDLVLQEIWGYLCCHYAIRSLMSQAAHHSGHDPDRLSFTAALRVVRQSVAHQGAFSP